MLYKLCIHVNISVWYVKIYNDTERHSWFIAKGKASYVTIRRMKCYLLVENFLHICIKKV